LILDEALDYLDDFMDLSQFDSDGNGTIDSVLLINTLEIDPTISYYWAFRYFNFYRDEAGEYYEYDNVHSKDYIWMPYQFIFEGDDENGNHIYNDTSAMNTDTFIHEFGHILGLEDYYDYSGINTPLVYDIMYNGLGDHNAYSKFNLGWLTTSRLVVTDSSVTLTLEDFSKNGDTIIIANNWDDKLGAYQEYYVLVYYTNNGLNAGEGNGYFDDEGVLVYHINAAMYMQENKDLYDVYNKNTDVTHEYGTKNNLIDYVLNTDGEHVYGVGDTMPTVIDDYGNELMYNFTVDAITSEYVTITFTLK
jgi:M6 family metalloprotease-like protein